MQDKIGATPPKPKKNPLEDDDILNLADEVLKDSDDDVIELTDIMSDEIGDGEDVLDLTEIIDTDDQGQDDIVDLTDIADHSPESDADILELEEIAETDESIVDLDEIAASDEIEAEDIFELDAILSEEVDEETTQTTAETPEPHDPDVISDIALSDLTADEDPDSNLVSAEAESEIHLDFEEEATESSVTNSLNSDTVDLTDIAPEKLDEELSLDFNMSTPAQDAEPPLPEPPVIEESAVFDHDDATPPPTTDTPESSDADDSQLADTVDLNDLMPDNLDDELKFDLEDIEADGADPSEDRSVAETPDIDLPGDESDLADTVELDEPHATEMPGGPEQADDLFTMDETMELTDQDREIIDQEFKMDLESEAEEKPPHEEATGGGAVDLVDEPDRMAPGDDLVDTVELDQAGDDVSNRPAADDTIAEPPRALNDLNDIDVPLSTESTADKGLNVSEHALGFDQEEDDEADQAPIDASLEESLAALGGLDDTHDSESTDDTDLDLVEDIPGIVQTTEDLTDQPADADAIDEPLTTPSNFRDLKESTDTDALPEPESDVPIDTFGFDQADEPSAEPSPLADTAEDSLDLSEADRDMLTAELNAAGDLEESVTDAQPGADADTDMPADQTSEPKAAFLDTSEDLNLDLAAENDFIDTLGMTIESEVDALDNFALDAPALPDEDSVAGKTSDTEPAAAAPSPDVVPSPAVTAQPDSAAPSEAIATEQLESALENVIKKMFSDKIETILHEVIEKTVTTEIDRLKKLLLEDSSDHR